MKLLVAYFIPFVSDENLLRALSLSKFPITKLSMELWFSFSSDTICFPKVITISAW